MSTRRTYAERIAELKTRQEQLREQERALLARQVVEERRERTKRHLRIGKEVESVIGHIVSDDDLNEILNLISSFFSETESSPSTNESDQNNYPDYSEPSFSFSDRFENA